MRKTNLIVLLLQKVFSKLWNFGLFENMDELREKPFHHFSQKRKKPKLSALRQKLFENTSCRSIKFITKDGALLDGVCFHPERKKVIFFSPGIGSFYENLADPKSVIFRFYTFFSLYFPNHALFMFNNRGIGKSSGTFHLKHLPLDTISAYRYLNEELGFDLSNILLYAHSLGGLHATIGAGEVQKQFPDAALSVISDRSLGNLGQFTHALAGKKAASMIKKLGLDLCAKQAWSLLKGKKLILVSRKDATIPYETGSFYQTVEASSVIHLEESSALSDHHTRAFTTDEASQIAQAILD